MSNLWCWPRTLGPWPWSCKLSLCLQVWRNLPALYRDQDQFYVVCHSPSGSLMHSEQQSCGCDWLPIRVWQHFNDDRVEELNLQLLVRLMFSHVGLQSDCVQGPMSEAMLMILLQDASHEQLAESNPSMTLPIFLSKRSLRCWRLTVCVSKTGFMLLIQMWNVCVKLKASFCDYMLLFLYQISHMALTITI